MNRITETAGISVISLLVVLSCAQFTFAASEVQGTLSSDGSSGAARETRGAEENVPVSTALQGTVVGGREDDSKRSMAALAGFIDDRTILGLMSVIIPLSLIAVGAGFFVLGRRV